MSPSMAEEEKGGGGEGRANGNVERGAGLDMVRDPTNMVFQTTFTMFHISSDVLLGKQWLAFVLFDCQQNPPLLKPKPFPPR